MNAATSFPVCSGSSFVAPPMTVCSKWLALTFMHALKCTASEQPDLYSMFIEDLAAELIFAKIADLIRHDNALMKSAIDAFKRQTATLATPDPSAGTELKRRDAQLTSKINFIYSAPHETKADQDEQRVALVFRPA
jgi:hypothetical protein